VSPATFARVAGAALAVLLAFRPGLARAEAG
jgi:hypothetical protein